jgi:hypothetical protein
MVAVARQFVLMEECELEEGKLWFVRMDSTAPAVGAMDITEFGKVQAVRLWSLIVGSGT